MPSYSLVLILHGVYVLFLFKPTTKKLYYIIIILIKNFKRNIAQSQILSSPHISFHTPTGKYTPARRQELGCRLLAWRCPSHFGESPRRIRGRRCNNSYGTLTPGDSSRSETCPPLPGSSDPSQDVLATIGEEKTCFYAQTLIYKPG